MNIFLSYLGSYCTTGDSSNRATYSGVELVGSSCREMQSIVEFRICYGRPRNKTGPQHCQNQATAMTKE